MTWERLYAIGYFWDYPRTGVADCDGRPHYFSNEFGVEADEYTERFWLSPIDPDLVPLVVESEAIGGRWAKWWAPQHAQGRGQFDPNDFGTVPEDKPRRAELHRQMGGHIKLDPDRTIVRGARFRRDRTPAPRSNGSRWPLKVPPPNPLLEGEGGREAAG